MKRLQVLPGITGWAQINGRSSIAFDQIVRYDIEYVENTGLMMDLKVLWYTVPAVLLGRGAK
jgi:lipopolysaccharide/colanic/teichoic acid biosynthesis glycosyltransferase